MLNDVGKRGLQCRPNNKGPSKNDPSSSRAVQQEEQSPMPQGGRPAGSRLGVLDAAVRAGPGYAMKLFTNRN